MGGGFVGGGGWGEGGGEVEGGGGVGGGEGEESEAEDGVEEGCGWVLHCWGIGWRGACLKGKEASWRIHHFLGVCLPRCNMLVTAGMGSMCDLSACWSLIA